MGMEHSNSPVCEQFFSWLNKFRNMKAMNESHYKLFILYIIDLHNLHIEKKVDTLANPLNPQRCSKVDELSGICNALDSLNLITSTKQRDVVELTDSENLDLFPPIEGNMANVDYEISDDGSYTCSYCTGTFKRIGNLRNHLSSKHNIIQESKCSRCEKQFADARKLSRHVKSCQV